MSTKTTVALLCFLVAAVLAVIGAFLPPVQGRLAALAVAAIAVGLAVEAA